MAEIKAKLTGRDARFLERSLNAVTWKVVLSVGLPLALYQGLNMLFTVLDTMIASHISKESVSAVAYLSQLNLLLSAVGGGLAVGAGIQISRAYGEEDFALVRKRVSSLYVICLAVGLVMLALLYGLGKTRLTLLLNFARVFVFRIPVFWLLQHCTQLGEASAGVVMMISNTSSGVLAAIISLLVIRQFRRRYLRQTENDGETIQ